MSLYCLSIKIIKTPRVAKMNKGKLMLLSKWPMCDSKKLRFIKKQEAGGLLSNLILTTTPSKVPLLGGILFEIYKNE